MIISSERRYIFVHIPKTGGTALTLALEARAKQDDILMGDTPKAKRRRGRLANIRTAGRLWKHSTLADIEGLVGVGELDDYFIVTMVRNPWDRLVSYYHWLRDQSFAHVAVGLARSLEFADFVAHPEIRASITASPPSHYLRDATGRERKAHFIRLEHLPADLAAFEAHLGFQLGEIPRANVSKRHKDHRIYYTEDTAAAVGSMCKEEISRFGYTF